MSATPTLYDFGWDGQGDLGVWCQPTGSARDGTRLVLVEAMVQEPDDNAGPDAEVHEQWTFGGDYLLASVITLKPGDAVWVDTDAPIYGAAAQRALERLQRIERESTQVAVNEQQEALLS